MIITLNMESNTDFTAFLPTEGSSKMRKPTASGKLQMHQLQQKQQRQQIHQQQTVKRRNQLTAVAEGNDIQSSQVPSTQPLDDIRTAFYPGAVGTVVSQSMETVVADDDIMFGNNSSNNCPRKRPSNDILISESGDLETQEMDQHSVKNFLKGRNLVNASLQGIQVSNAQMDTENREEDDDLTDEEELIQRFQSAKFPTAADIKRTQVFTLSELEKGHVYMVLGGQLANTSFENEFGETEKGTSIVVKVLDTASNDTANRLKVRLTGLSYERLVNQSRYMEFIATDDYFFLYEGMIASTMNPGHKYHRISVMHAPHGTKKWRNDMPEAIPATKKRKLQL